MIIDLHNHTKLYSNCSQLDPRWLISEAVRKKIPGIAITEHDRYFDRQKADVLEKEFENKIKIYIGMEVTAGEDHILLFGEKIKEGHRHNGLQLLEEIADKNIAAILAHPFRWNGIRRFANKNFAVEYFKHFTAIEVYSANIDKKQQKIGHSLCSKHNIPMTGGSDAHSTQMACLYATKFTQKPANELELAKMLLYKEYTPIFV